MFRSQQVDRSSSCARQFLGDASAEHARDARRGHVSRQLAVAQRVLASVRRIGHGAWLAVVPTAPAMDLHPPVKRMEVDRGSGATYPYLLGATLGEGSYGLVREGLDVNTAKVVAIKSLDRRLLKKQRRGLENLDREIRVHKRLGRHDTIVDLENVVNIETKSRIHLVLEYMHCGSVQDVLDRAPGKKLGQAQARRYFAGLLAGLQHIHSRGVVHKDIKPANLMLNRSGEVRLSDFGCAEELNEYEKSDAVTRTLGSPAFQSPEIAQGVESFSGTATDVWAAGVTLFQMVVGRTPFDADNLVELFEKIGEAKVELPDSLQSPALRDLLLSQDGKCLLKREAERLTVEEARRHAWMNTSLSPGEGEAGEGAVPVEEEQEVEPQVRQPTILKADFDALDLYPAEQNEDLPKAAASSSGAGGGAGGGSAGGGAGGSGGGGGGADGLIPAPALASSTTTPLGGLFDPPPPAQQSKSRPAAAAVTGGGGSSSLFGLFDPPGADAGAATAAGLGAGVGTAAGAPRITAPVGVGTCVGPPVMTAAIAMDGNDGGQHAPAQGGGQTAAAVDGGEFGGLVGVGSPPAVAVGLPDLLRFSVGDAELEPEPAAAAGGAGGVDDLITL